MKEKRKELAQNKKINMEGFCPKLKQVKIFHTPLWGNGYQEIYMYITL